MSAPSPLPTAAALGTNHRILIIDDTPAIHEDFRKILGAELAGSDPLSDMMASVFGSIEKRAGQISFELDSAFQGREGLEKVKAARATGRPYAVAFVDVRMPPGWDGVETIAHLWDEDPDLQIIICTAYSDYSWDGIVGKLGHSDQLVILKKPFDHMEVLQLAHSMTKKWSLGRQAAARMEDLDRIVNERTSELRRSEERFSTAFNVSPLPMAILRLVDLRCVDVNRGFLTVTGLTREQALAGDVWQAGLYGNPILRSSVIAGHAISHRDCTLRTRAGETLAARIWVEPFELPGGPHLLAVVEDVSERSKLETQLRQAQKMESVGHLAAGIAHDFNNMITVIQGHASLRLASGNLNGEVASSLRDMNDAAARAAGLTRQLLAFSRRQVMQPRVVRLNAVVRDISAMLRRLIPESIELDLRQPPEVPPIFADVCNLEQVILNLVVNARDAMTRGGRLTIASETVVIDRGHAARWAEAREGCFVRLSVADTGTGMDADTLAQIFEPFFTTKEVGKGTGMGLATVHGIVKQHEGWIEVSSIVGEGSTFFVYLPVTQRAEDARSAELPLPPHPTGPTKTLLVVEDDPAVRLLAQTVLEDSGYQVLEAGDGPTALRVSRGFSGTIHLLLTDMVMPGGLSGKDVAEQLVIERPDLRVVYSSGYSFELFGQQLQLRDGFDYLPKPYYSQQLLAAVHRMLLSAAALAPSANAA